MLSQRTAHTAIPVSDLDRAAQWYEEKLGLKPLWKKSVGILYGGPGGGQLQIYPSAEAGQAPQTLIGWETQSIESDVAELKTAGVVFEEYDTPEIKTVGSIATIDNVKAAWFRDPDGNILSMVQFPDWG
jgi:catechol 2,3-dioxygenase-like lactoylglutathione lyase family enzyme